MNRSPTTKVLAEVSSSQKAIQVAWLFGLGDANNIPGPNLEESQGIKYSGVVYGPLLYPEYVEEVFEKGTEIAIESFRKYWDAFGSDIDILFICGTDFEPEGLYESEVFRDLYALL